MEGQVPTEEAGDAGPARAGGREGEPRPAPPRAATWCALALALIAAIASFGLPDRLVWDDYTLIGELDTPVTAKSFAAAFHADFFDRARESRDRHYYRPLVQVSYLLGAAMSGREPFFFGLANLAFHLAACGLLFALLHRGGVPPPAAAAGTVLFGLMPRLTESVYWISGRTDPLATIFVLAGLLCWDDRARRAPRRVAAAALLFLGLLCKEVALAGVAALLLREIVGSFASGDAGAGRPGRSGRAARIALLCAPVAAYLAIRLAVLDGSWQTSLSLGVGARLVLAAEAIGRYATLLLDPLHPALRIGHVVAARDPLLVTFGAGVVIASGVLASRWVLRHPDRPEVVGLGLAAAALAPTLHLVPIGSDTVAADRFLYLPLAGLTLAATGAIVRLPQRPRRAIAAGAMVVTILFAWACLERARQWSDDVVLWHHTLAHADPIDSVPHAWMGLALQDRGEPAAALAHFKHAIRIEMSKPPVFRKGTLVLDQLANVSASLSALGRDTEALRAIEEAQGHRPRHVAYHEQRARVLARLLRFADARAALDSALRLGGDATRLAHWSDELTTLESQWNALPTPRADESTSVIVKRALLLSRLGADAAAGALWRAALARPDVEPEWIASAAAFHTMRAHRAEAEALIDRLSGVSPTHRDDARMLREALQANVLEPVPDRVLSAAADLEQRS